MPTPKETESPSPTPPAERGSRRLTAGDESPDSRRRLVLRLLGIPVLAVAAFLIYRGLHDRFFLPACDSTTATNTLAGVFKQMKIEPLRYEPIATVSSAKTEVVCKATLPLADGATLIVEYRFFWQGSTAQMKYSISRKEPQSSEISPVPR